MRKVAITTTVPVEVIFAAGVVPVDLNNIFVAHDEARRLVEVAEMAGYPRNVCGWIKGLYGTVLEHDDLQEVIAVNQGDCTNTHALMETLEVEGITTIPFSFPFDRDYRLLEMQIEKLMEYFQVSKSRVQEVKKDLDRVRQSAWEIDRLTWEENKVTGFENHLYQVSCSDFEGDFNVFETNAKKFITEVQSRKPRSDEVRLGFIGVPPIITDLYHYLESIGARVVYNEIQRQFSMPFKCDDLVKQYLMYTYPYHVEQRIKDINEQVQQREIDGLIHYTQSFCFRQIQDMIIRKRVKLPILTLEGDNPGKLDARNKMRIDAFVEMLR
ncbi:2-hydroxyacyl-CoA dehydratase family protein [Metallumcola ferriviriculae]|uniref:2-hydroxyacyl-CoA dehydratase family protein n=1 Tax=Metallumcola ferriviriculae TaxID=3039180 RepID=A0AAU0ULE5_9FIRM|nr:2-hydroxyacyl-CoA dehydratase family protein [Desulfitibacteraceae bacterium MK1]